MVVVASARVEAVADEMDIIGFLGVAAGMGGAGGLGRRAAAEGGVVVGVGVASDVAGVAEKRAVAFG